MEDSEEEIEYLLNFLKKRGIDEDSVEKLRTEKIDCSTVTSLSDEQLQKFIPKLGDIHATKRFCNDFVKKKGQKKRTQSLIAKFRKKTKTAMGFRGCDTTDSASDDEKRQGDQRRQKLKDNKNATKKDRKIELGWFDFEFQKNSYHQVKTLNGGGTRDVKALKSRLPKDIIEHGKKIFFPKGVSKKGHITKFDFELRDFTEQPIPETCTVGEMYAETNVKLLRYYIYTKKKKDMDDADKTSSDELEDPQINIPTVPFPKQNLDTASTLAIQNPAGGSPNLNLNSTNTLAIQNPEAHLPCLNPEAASTLPVTNVQSISDDSLFVDSNLTFKITNDNISVINLFNPEQASQSTIEYTYIMDEDDTLPLDYNHALFLPDPSESITCPQETVRIHQGNCFQEMIKLFSKEDFKLGIDQSKCKVERVLPNGEIEKGEVERSVVKMALENFDEVDKEELSDVMISHDSKKLPTAANIKALVREIAHKEILQEPKFIIECWRPVFKQMHLSVSQLNDIFAQKQPTVKKVLKLLEFPINMDMEQQVTSSYLKKYVKGLDKKELETFVRFCTGSNIIGEKIIVEFNKLTGFERRPTAQTCGCVLKIPTSYENYAEIREEFGNILRSNVWEMGYV